MAVTNTTPADYTASKGFRGAIAEINPLLESKISWLDTAYGVAELRRIERNEKESLYLGRYPAVMLDDEEYKNMLPDTHLGNYCFWKIEERPVELSDFYAFADFSVIFFFDHKDIVDAGYSAYGNAKRDIRTAFRRLGATKAGVRLTSIDEGFDKVYEGYDINKVDGIELMYPNGALRVNGIIRMNAKEC